jgi:hypothetical protein
MVKIAHFYLVILMHELFCKDEENNSMKEEEQQQTTQPAENNDDDIPANIDAFLKILACWVAEDIQIEWGSQNNQDSEETLSLDK